MNEKKRKEIEETRRKVVEYFAPDNYDKIASETVERLHHELARNMGLLPEEGYAEYLQEQGLTDIEIIAETGVYVGGAE